MVSDFITFDGKIETLCNSIAYTSLWEIEKKDIYGIHAGN
jgi:hypothetical protein